MNMTEHEKSRKHYEKAEFMTRTWNTLKNVK